MCGERTITPEPKYLAKLQAQISRLPFAANSVTHSKRASGTFNQETAFAMIGNVVARREVTKMMKIEPILKPMLGVLLLTSPSHCPAAP